MSYEEDNSGGGVVKGGKVKGKELEEKKEI